jgi:predicted nucleic acid-binding Zn ribbon protein
VRQKHTSLADALKQALPEELSQRIYSIGLVQKRWEEAVGRELALRSEPDSLTDGVLTVRVTDLAWGKMIARLEKKIVPAINRACGSHLVRRINFTKRSHLMLTPAPKPAARARAAAKPPRAITTAAERIEDEELKALVTRTAAHYLRAQSERGRT